LVFSYANLCAKKIELPFLCVQRSDSDDSFSRRWKGISFALMDECTSACDPANELHLLLGKEDL